LHLPPMVICAFIRKFNEKSHVGKGNNFAIYLLRFL
jgi:hypothetical protein